jgi:hypothetical protein
LKNEINQNIKKENELLNCQENLENLFEKSKKENNKIKS